MSSVVLRGVKFVLFEINLYICNVKNCSPHKLTIDGRVMKKNLLIGIGIAIALVIAVLQVVIIVKIKDKDKDEPKPEPKPEQVEEVPPVGLGPEEVFVEDPATWIEGDFIEDANVNLNMNMVYVAGGTFVQGYYEVDARRVTLDSFWIGECEVTQSQWEKIMGTNIYDQRDKAQWQSGEDRPLRGVGPQHPMYNVSYAEAKEFCRRLTSLTGRLYDLPTESQWEYAARGGVNGRNYEYSGSDNISAVAWYKNNSNTSTHAVKGKRPNELGLYDMSGNVQEWCRDWHDEYNYYDCYNPTGPSEGVRRVVRGGGWRWEDVHCCVWAREKYLPTLATSYLGFRVVCYL